LGGNWLNTTTLKTIIIISKKKTLAITNQEDLEVAAFEKETHIDPMPSVLYNTITQTDDDGNTY